MKKYLIKVMAGVLILGQLMSTSSFAITADEDSRVLTEEQKEVIYEKIEEINSRYDYGEPFSKEDQVFIEKYVPMLNKKNSSDIGIMNSQGFYNSNTSSDGLVTAVISGTATNEQLSPLQHSFGANYTTSVHVAGRPYLKKIEAEVNCSAYGAVGSNGQLGKIYDKTLKDSTTPFVLNFNQVENYSGFVVYAVVNVKSIITYTYGSFSVNATF